MMAITGVNIPEEDPIEIAAPEERGTESNIEKLNLKPCFVKLVPLNLKKSVFHYSLADGENQGRKPDENGSSSKVDDNERNEEVLIADENDAAASSAAAAPHDDEEENSAAAPHDDEVEEVKDSEEKEKPSQRVEGNVSSRVRERRPASERVAVSQEILRRAADKLAVREREFQTHICSLAAYAMRDKGEPPASKPPS